MKLKNNCKFLMVTVITIIIVIIAVTVWPQAIRAQQKARTPNYLNFQKLILYHAPSVKSYYLAATATDDSVRIANLDTMNVHVSLEMMDKEKKFIDNEDINIIPLGNMYNQVRDGQYTFFRFNLIIDNSSSIDIPSLQHVQHTLKRFTELVPFVFEAQVIRFSSTIQVKTPFTKDRNTLVQAITQPLPRGGTALYDAIDMGIQELRAKQDEIPLRFAVVLTDGKDTASSNNRHPVAFKQKIVNLCKNHYIPLFIVGVTNNVEHQLMKDISEFGLYQHITRFPDIDRAFDVILNVIKDTYIFKIPAVGNFNEIRTLYLVKKTRAGNLETIQDFIVN